MSNQNRSRTASAFLTAVLLASVFAPTILVGFATAHDDPDSDITIHVEEGATDITGQTRWFSGTQSIALQIEVVRDASTLPVDLAPYNEVVFAPQDADSASEGTFTFAAGTMPSGWTASPFDEGADGVFEGIRFAAGVGESLGPGETLVFPLTVTRVAGGSEFAPAQFVTSVTGSFPVTGGTFASNNPGSTGLHLGSDATSPTILLAFADGTGNLDSTIFHSETGPGPGVTVTFGDSLSGVSTRAVSVNGVPQAPCATNVCTVSLATLVDGSNVVTGTATDSAGNVNAASSLTVLIDRTAPNSGTVLATGGTLGPGGWYRIGPALSVSPSDARSGVGSLTYSWANSAGGATVAGNPLAVPVMVTPTTIAEGTSTLTYSSIDRAHTGNTESPARTYQLLYDVTNPAGSITGYPQDQAPAGTLEATELRTGSGGLVFDVSYTSSDAVSGVHQVQPEIHTPYDAPGAFTAYGPALSAATGSFEVLPTADGTYQFRVTVTDKAGNTFTSTASSILVHPPPGQIITNVATTLTPNDVLVNDRQFVTLSIHTDDVTNPSLPSSARNVRVRVYEGSLSGPLVATVLTNTAGNAAVSVQKTSSQQVVYVAKAIEQLAGAGFRTVSSDPVSRTITWTHLVAGAPTFSASDVAGRGEPLTLQVPLTWAGLSGPSAVATGLAGVSNTIGFIGTGTGKGSTDPLVHTPATSSVVVVGASETVTPGTYAVTYAHADEETVSFVSAGASNGYVNTAAYPGDAPSTFSIPAAVPIEGQWTGIVAGAVTLTNVARPLDLTDGFVNEDETIQVDVPVFYTANYDASSDGTSARDPASGATVSLFQATHLASGAPIPDPLVVNAAARKTVQDGAAGDFNATSGIVGIRIAKSDFLNAANTYGLTLLATAGSTGLVQEIGTTADRADYAATSTVTYTGVIVSYVADSLTGTEDPTPGAITAGNELTTTPWWLSADADEGSTATDEVTLTVKGVFSHNTAVVAAGATIGAYLGATPLGGATPLQEVTNLAGEATFTIDPDAYGLDYARRTLTFRIVTAPEPIGPPTDAITYDAGAFVHDFLWTKIHLDVVNPLGDSELYLGGEGPLAVMATYYHDMDGSPGNDSAASGGAMAFQLVDTVPTGDVLTTRVENGAALAAGVDTDTFNVARGCSILNDADNTIAECYDSPDFNQAGWHRFTASATGTPHGIAIDDPANRGHADLLWTGAALDLTTDRITQAAGSGIVATARAYFAHDYDFAAGALSLAQRTFDRNVTIDLKVITPPSTLVPAALVPAGGSYQTTLNSAGPAHIQFRAVGSGGNPIEDPTAGLDLTPLGQVADSATIERVWLGLTVTPGWSEAADALDYNGDGDSTDLLYSKDALALRETDIVARMKATLSDGAVDTNIASGYAGYSFTSNEPNAMTNMPQRTLATTPVPLGTQDAFILTGSESVNTPTSNHLNAGAFSYSAGCLCWSTTIPGAAHTGLEEGIPFAFTASLNVASNPGGTTTGVSDLSGNTFTQTYTAILLQFVQASTSDGKGELPATPADAFWLNNATTGTYRVRALWAHSADGDADSYIATPSAPDLGDVALGAAITSTNGDFTALAVPGFPGLYDFSLASPGPAYMDLQFLATAAPDPTSNDAAQDFTGSLVPSSNLLSLNHISQVVRFTKLVYSAVGTVPAYANVNEAVTVDFQVSWADTGASLRLATDGPTVWEFGTQRIATSDYGVGQISLVRSSVGAGSFAPTYLPAEVAPHGIWVSTVPPTPIQVTWTGLDAVAGTTSGTPLGGTYTNPESNPDADVFSTGAVAAQPFTLRFAHNGAAAAGGLVEIAGVSRVADGTGQASVSLTSTTESWYNVLGRGLSASIGGKTITASVNQGTNWIGFDSGTAGSVDPSP